MIELLDAVKTYTQGRRTVSAVRGVTLRVRCGEFVTIMGPSGSGKSTLMHLMGALDTPSGGRAVFHGRDLQAMSDRQRSLLRRDPKNAGYLQDWMLARYSMSNLLYDLGETDRAKALRAEARADVADLVARDPANKDWRVWQGKLAKPLTKGSK